MTGSSTTIPIIGSIPSSFLKEYIPPSVTDLKNTLLTASDKLQEHSNQSDTTLFILQNLASLTMPHSFVPENAHQMSVLIMHNTHDIRDHIMTAYSTHQKRFVSLGTTRSSCITNHAHFDEASEQICSASLTVLTNSILAIYKQHKELNVKKEYHIDQHDGGEEKMDDCHFENEDEQEQDSFNSFIDMFVPLLVEAVRNHTLCPHNAYLALKCLEAMVIHSARTRELLCEMKGNNDGDHRDVGTLVEEARLYGRREHLKLEQAATDTMEALSRFEVLEMIEQNHEHPPNIRNSERSLNSLKSSREDN